MSAVTVGGKPWMTFDAAAETIDFSANDLTDALLKDMAQITATFAA
jgi:hypothetical protein